MPLYSSHFGLPHCLVRTAMAFKQLIPVLALALSLSVTQGAIVKRVTCPGSRNVVANSACCKLFDVRDDIQKNMFEGGKCNDVAHEALRL